MKLLDFTSTEELSLLKYLIKYGIDDFTDNAAKTEEDSAEFYTLAYWMIKTYQKGQQDTLTELENF